MENNGVHFNKVHVLSIFIRNAKKSHDIEIAVPNHAGSILQNSIEVSSLYYLLGAVERFFRPCPKKHRAMKV